MQVKTLVLLLLALSTVQTVCASSKGKKKFSKGGSKMGKLAKGHGGDSGSRSSNESLSSRSDKDSSASDRGSSGGDDSDRTDGSDKGSSDKGSSDRSSGSDKPSSSSFSAWKYRKIEAAADLKPKSDVIERFKAVKEAGDHSSTVIKDRFKRFIHYAAHDAKSWKSLSDDTILAMMRHLVQKNWHKTNALLTQEDMAEILQNRRSDAPCVLIGTVFDEARLNNEIMSKMSTDCYEVVLGVKKPSGRSKYAKFFTEQRPSDVHIPSEVVRRYVDGLSQLGSSLRSRNSTSHGENDMDTCGLLGLLSHHMSTKQAGQIGWSCLKSAVETEKRIDRAVYGDRGSGGKDKRGKKGKKGKPSKNKKMKGVKDDWYKISSRMLANMSSSIIRDGKKEAVDLLLKRVAFGGFGASIQTELLRSEDYCEMLKASDVFGEFNDYEGLRRNSVKGPRPATDKEAARRMSPECFSALKGVERMGVERPLRDWPEELFAKVTDKIDPSFFQHATAKQIELFGTKVRKDDLEHACTYLDPEAIPEKFFSSITPKCFASWVAGNAEGHGSLPRLGKSLTRLSTTILSDIGGEHIAAFSSEDLATFSTEQWAAFFKKDGGKACASIPESAASALFGSDDSRKSGRFAPDASCMSHMAASLQEAAVRNYSSALPEDALSMIDANQAGQWAEDFFAVLNKVRQPALISNLGSKLQGRSHPCINLDRATLLSLPMFAANVSPSCAIAVKDLDQIDDKQLLTAPLAVLAQLPLDKLKRARDTSKFTASDVQVLTSSERFCKTVDHATFASIPIPSRAMYSSRCIAAFAFLPSIGQADMESLPAEAFSEFELQDIFRVPTLIWMTPSQLHAMGSKIPADKMHPAAAINADAMAVFSVEQIAALTLRHVAAIPPGSFSKLSPSQVAAFEPEALTSMTLEQVQAMSDAAFSGFKPNQLERLGEATTAKNQDANPAKAFTNSKVEKLSPEAKAVALTKISKIAKSAAMGQGAVSTVAVALLVATLILL